PDFRAKSRALLFQLPDERKWDDCAIWFGGFGLSNRCVDEKSSQLHRQPASVRAAVLFVAYSACAAQRLRSRNKCSRTSVFAAAGLEIPRNVCEPAAPNAAKFQRTRRFR